MGKKAPDIQRISGAKVPRKYVARFFHPDYTVGSGITPDRPYGSWTKAFTHYHRWRISLRPETDYVKFYRLVVAFMVGIAIFTTTAALEII